MSTDHEIIRSLPPVHADMFDAVFNSGPGSAKRYNRTMSFTCDADMMDVLNGILQNRNMPFLTDRSTMLRHAAAAFIESVKQYLSPDLQTTWSRLHNQQRRITNETYARLISDNIEADIVNLTFITEAKEWAAVADHLAKVCREIAGLSEPVWRTAAARGWTEQMRGLKIQWSMEMSEESPQQWARVRESLERFDDMARV